MCASNRNLSGSKNLFPNFETFESNAVDRSNSNSHFRGDPLPP
jgi:hypothetical protein